MVIVPKKRRFLPCAVLALVVLLLTAGTAIAATGLSGFTMSLLIPARERVDSETQQHASDAGWWAVRVSSIGKKVLQLTATLTDAEGDIVAQRSVRPSVGMVFHIFSLTSPSLCSPYPHCPLPAGTYTVTLTITGRAGASLIAAVDHCWEATDPDGELGLCQFA